MKVFHKKFAWKLRTYHWVTKHFDGDEHNYEQWQSFGIAYYFFSIRIWFSSIYKEEVPSFAWIQNNTLGFTDWKSKIPRWCHEIKNKV